jgi:hypothetical protein
LVRAVALVGCFAAVDWIRAAAAVFVGAGRLLLLLALLVFALVIPGSVRRGGTVCGPFAVIAPGGPESLTAQVIALTWPRSRARTPTGEHLIGSRRQPFPLGFTSPSLSQLGEHP